MAYRSASLRNQLLVIYGFSLAIGLEFGLFRILVSGRISTLFTSLAASAVLGTVVLLLWRRVFPRLPARTGARRTLWEAGVALGTICVASFVLTEVISLFVHGFSILVPYRGGDRQVLISAAFVRFTPLAFALLPVVPTAVMAVIGYRRYWAPMVELEDRTQELRELAATAQLGALRAQIHPHFFFNSLNSIAQLIRTDPAEAEACIERLAQIFRYLTRQADREFVPLADELEIADAYLDIQRARFGDKLAVRKHGDTLALRHPIPNLILQPLVENAVRHGISRKLGGGTVTIEASLHNGYLRLRVADDGTGMSPEDLARAYDRGIGLRNIRDRLARLYGPEVRPEIRSAPDTGTSVTLHLPLAAAGPQHEVAAGTTP